MWNQFKLFVSAKLGSIPEIQPQVFQDGLLSFHASQKLPMGTVKVLAPTQSGHMEVAIDIQSFDPKEELYRGKVADEVFALDAMRLERRGEFRLPIALRVTSPDLPGRFGRTEDLSLSGVRLTLDGKITPGDYVALTIDLGDPKLPDINIKAEVRWCAEKKEGKYQAGVRFSNLPRDVAKLISQFIKRKVALGSTF